MILESIKNEIEINRIKQKRLKKRKEYNERTKEKRALYQIEYRKKNRDRYREYHTQYMRKRRLKERMDILKRKRENERIEGEKWNKLDLIYINKMNNLTINKQTFNNDYNNI